MIKKRKNTNSTPGHKRMRRNARLQAVKTWVSNYRGKNVVKGYSKHFAVDKLCTVKELQLAGIHIDSDYIEELKRNIEGGNRSGMEKIKRKQEGDVLDQYAETDENFAYIAGYTSMGFPYGVTWEEQEDMEKKKYLAVA